MCVDEGGTWCMLDKFFTNELPSQTLFPETRFHCVIQAGFELTTLLPLPREW